MAPKEQQRAVFPLSVIVIASLVWIVSAGPATTAAQEAAPDAVDSAVEAVKPETTTEPEATTDRSAARFRRVAASMWWNDAEVGTTLELTAIQRDRMDEVFVARSAVAAAGSRSAKDRGNLLIEAARSGDGGAVNALLAEALEARRASAGVDLEIAREVLGILSPTQLTKLAESFPRVLERPWVLRLGGDQESRARRSATRPARRPRPSQQPVDPS